MKFIFIGILICSFNFVYADATSQANNDIIDSPDLILDSLLTDLIKLTQKKPLDFQKLSQFLQKNMANYIDFDYISRWTAGRYYRYLDPTQKQNLSNQLKQLILNALADRFIGYQVDELHILSTERGQNGEVHVHIALDEATGESPPLLFRFYHTQKSWMIFDIALNNHSLLNYYQYYFKTSMQRNQLKAFYGD